MGKKLLNLRESIIHYLLVLCLEVKVQLEIEEHGTSQLSKTFPSTEIKRGSILARSPRQWKAGESRKVSFLLKSTPGNDRVRILDKFKWTSGAFTNETTEDCMGQGTLYFRYQGRCQLRVKDKLNNGGSFYECLNSFFPASKSDTTLRRLRAESAIPVCSPSDRSLASLFVVTASCSQAVISCLPVM